MPASFQDSTAFYPWSEIELVSEDSGVYAWYFRHEVSDADFENLKGDLASLDVSEVSSRHQVVLAFLEYHVFRPYRDSPYLVTLSGPLKPKYKGNVQAQDLVSKDLVERLAKDPDRLREILRVLANSAPMFASPVYIGMAINLRSRLLSHKAKINDLIDRDELPNEDSAEGSSFAFQVVSRGIDPTSLFVCVHEVSVVNGEHNDVENLLNRINFPIFGRN